jgi:hypothetical protein
VQTLWGINVDTTIFPHRNVFEAMALPKAHATRRYASVEAVYATHSKQHLWLEVCPFEQAAPPEQDPVNKCHVWYRDHASRFWVLAATVAALVHMPHACDPASQDGAACTQVLEGSRWVASHAVDYNPKYWLNRLVPPQVAVRTVGD